MSTRTIKFYLIATLLSAASITRGDIVAQWTFENTNNLLAAIGSGVASNVGGTTTAFAGGQNSTYAWNTSQYPAQGNGSGTAGVSFYVDTTGYQDIIFSYNHRASGAASRWAQIDYTLDGGANWVTGYWTNSGALSPHDTFYSNNVSFVSVTGANNNPNFGVRVVSIFSPVPFDQNATLPDYGANEAYMRANAQASYTPGGGTGTGDYSSNGTWRFDNVTFNGSVVPEPGTALLFLGGLALCGWARRRSQN